MKQKIVFITTILILLLGSNLRAYAEENGDAKEGKAGITLKIIPSDVPKLPDTQTPPPKKIETPPKVEGPKPSGVLPNTGEKVTASLVTAGILLVVLCIVAFFWKRRKKEKEEVENQ